MSDMKIFENKDFGKIRVQEINGETYFVGKDITEILGYKNTRDALLRHVDNEDKGVVKHDTLGGVQEITVINESGLYSLILSSKLPKAKEFKRWVTSEVLPSIRKTGGYISGEENMTEEELVAQAFLVVNRKLEEKTRENEALRLDNSKLVVQNQIMQPKAEYFDDLVDRNLLTSFRETAKELKIKEKNFIRFLLDNKYIFRNKKGKLEPYANKNDGLFETKETKNDKTNWSGTQTLITPKGRETFKLLYIE